MSDSCQSRERQKRFESLNLTRTVCDDDDDDDDDERQSVNVMFTRGLDGHERIILILRANNARARTSLSSFATSFRSPKMFSRSFTMPLICRLTRTLLTPPSAAAAALTDILRSGARHGCAARLLVKIAHVDARMLSSRRRRISSCATRPHAHARCRHKH